MKSIGVVVGYRDMQVPFSLVSEEENSKNLVVFLPGVAYSVQSPAFHYSQEIFLDHSFDVLQVNYRYNDKAYDNFTIEELSEAIKYDVRTVLDKVLTDTSYEKFYFVAKSLGTIAMSSELNRDIFKEAHAIWLTPLLQRDDVFAAMVNSENRGLCIIGDNDRCYVEERFDQLKNKSNLVAKLLPNVNHSLEYDHNMVESIDILKEVIKDIQEFVV
ncbi:MAG TPA: alpha/beta hydrolase [Paenisporosarcina sp.]|nr:alpha/beta hydrolase [Paenisporosarcina sp.]